MPTTISLTVALTIACGLALTISLACFIVRRCHRKMANELRSALEDLTARFAAAESQYTGKLRTPNMTYGLNDIRPALAIICRTAKYHMSFATMEILRSEVACENEKLTCALCHAGEW